MFGISLSTIGDFAAVLAIAGLFFYGMYVGESRAHAADAAQHARQLTAVVAALQQQARERDAEVHKLTEASDNANRQIDGLLAPSPVPVVRLCYLRPAGGDQTRGASTPVGGPGALSASAPGVGAKVHGADRGGSRLQAGPDVGGLLDAYAKVFEATAAVARGLRAAGR